MTRFKYHAILLLFLPLAGLAQDNRTSPGPVFDSLLAARLGADEYGMKHYVMAFLKEGPTKISDSTERAQLQMAHLRNIKRLASDGKLIVAGPFLDDQPLRGIFIFNVDGVAEAQKLTESDPAIKAGTLVMELHPWYGSAALIEAVKLHQRIRKKTIGE